MNSFEFQQVESHLPSSDKVEAERATRFIIRKNRMIRKVIWVLLIITAAVAVFFVGYFIWDRVTQASTTELKQIVQRDGVAFEAQSIPDEVVDRLASKRVVLLGETHFLREHREFAAELLRQLHSRGYRQLLVEWTQVADWLLADFVNDGGLEPDWTPPLNIAGGVLAAAVRDFNRTLPDSEHIQVHGIDVTIADYGGADSFHWSLSELAGHLPDQGPLEEFFRGDYGTPEKQMALLEKLQADLAQDRETLAATWGDAWYDTVVELVEVELRSVPIRAIRESDYDESVRLREETIKWLADRRISSVPGGSLINYGSTHAQKKQLWGTEIEWLGDYLVHKSPAVDGSIVVLWVPAAYIVADPASDYPDSDLSASPKNELLQVVNQTWPEQTVFLPLDDPLFSDGRVPLNSSGEIYVASPHEHYDGIVLLNRAHRDLGDN